MKKNKLYICVDECTGAELVRNEDSVTNSREILQHKNGLTSLPRRELLCASYSARNDMKINDNAK